jgi:ATP-dependent DNA helicase RecQ
VIDVREGPVFLIDDMVDSRWTLTVLGAELRWAGSGPVYPVALTDTSNRGQ